MRKAILTAARQEDVGKWLDKGITETEARDEWTTTLPISEAAKMRLVVLGTRSNRTPSIFELAVCDTSDRPVRP